MFCNLNPRKVVRTECQSAAVAVERIMPSNCQSRRAEWLPQWLNLPKVRQALHDWVTSVPRHRQVQMI